MNNKSRTKNAKLNIIFGYIAQVGILILSFVGRRIFLTYLSADYLGINGLYSNILTLLSLAELGLDTAVVYTLYKPVAEHDVRLIHSLLAFFRKIYCALSFCIFTVGIALIPFLPYLIKSNLLEKDLIFYYILFLINTVSSYFVAHKIALLSASQEQRVQKIVSLSFNLCLQVIHILVLLIWKNYYAYIIATVINTLATNIFLSIITNRLHPEIFVKQDPVEFNKKPIISRVISTFLYKIGAVLVNSTDNILISVLVSTAAVGYYSNYFTIVSAFNGFLAIITTSLVAGIGNLATKGKHREQGDLFDMMVLFYHYISAIGFIGFSMLLNNFVEIWLGPGYLFDSNTVFIIALNFYLTNAISPVWMFREANGIFQKVKFLLLIRAFLNIVFSIWFGIMWGVLGIFMATALSLLLTNFWYEPHILSKFILIRSEKIYWKKQAKYFLLTIACYVICGHLINSIERDITHIILKGIVVCLVCSIVFFAANFNSKEIKKLKGYIFKS